MFGEMFLRERYKPFVKTDISQAFCVLGVHGWFLRQLTGVNDKINYRFFQSQDQKGGDAICIVHSLKFFCVSGIGSFNKAAEKLYISPLAVIKQINLPEESLNL